MEVITAVPLSTVGELNAQSSLHGRVYTLGMGTCGVDVPLPPYGWRRSGIFLNIQNVECPPEMLTPEFQACTQSIFTRLDVDSCSCIPVTGNPPMPAEAAACPTET